MKPSAEKRESTRTPFHYPILCELNNKESGPSHSFQWPGNGVDISATGIGILSAHPLNPGERIKINLYLGPKDTDLPALSEVRWSRPADGHYRVGLQFLT